VRITERAYAPWVQARQQKLEAAVRQAWSSAMSDTTRSRAIL
jgi:hypothetical protein